MAVLHRGGHRTLALHAGIATAFQEVHPGNRGQAQQILNAEQHGLIDQCRFCPRDHQLVLPGVWVNPAAVVPLVVQTRWRDDPEQPLQGCEGCGILGHRGQPFQGAALQAPLVPGGLAVGMGRYRLTQAIGWRRRGVIGRSRLPGRWGRNCGRWRQGCGHGQAHEVSS